MSREYGLSLRFYLFLNFHNYIVTHCYTEKQKIESIQQSNLLIKFSVTNAKLIPNVDKSGLIVTVKVLRHFVTTTHRIRINKSKYNNFPGFNDCTLHHENVSLEVVKWESWWVELCFRLCTMTLTRLELLKPLEPSLTEVIISVSMQVNKPLNN